MMDRAMYNSALLHDQEWQYWNNVTRMIFLPYWSVIQVVYVELWFKLSSALTAFNIFKVYINSTPLCWSGSVFHHFVIHLIYTKCTLWAKKSGIINIQIISADIFRKMSRKFLVHYDSRASLHMRNWNIIKYRMNNVKSPRNVYKLHIFDAYGLVYHTLRPQLK